MKQIVFCYVLIFFMTVLGSFGGFFLKKSTNCSPIYKVLFSKFLYIGLFLYVLGALLNIWVLKFLPYSVVLPLSAITYIWTMISSRFLLDEKITKPKLIGIAAILVGAVLISL